VSDLKFYLALNKISVVGATRFRRLLERFGSPEEVWKAGLSQLQEVKGIGREVAEGIVRERERINLEEEMILVEEKKVKVLTLEDEDYPENLKNIYDPPPVLYVKGEIKKEDNQALAIVGSRRSTYYGKDLSQRLALGLSQKGFTIVSGMARGIDTFAHQGALKAKGRTIAVLGCGVDIVYPPESRELAEEIAGSGALISEFCLGTRPLAGNFPIRNRIISGLAQGVVVVQAGERSGATITADFALDQGREVFAVPGNVNVFQSKGTHRLIKQGAKLVEDINDILEELGIERVSVEKKEARQSLPEVEQSVFNSLSFEPKQIDEIIKDSSLPSGTVSSSLMLLEMKGLVKQLAGKMFVREK